MKAPLEEFQAKPAAPSSRSRFVTYLTLVIVVVLGAVAVFFMLPQG